MFTRKKEREYSARYKAVSDIRLAIEILKECIAEEDFDRKNQTRIRTMEGILSNMQLDFSRD